ncbi:phage holin family protein [Lawsonibacter celer]|jgi:toxin secretion/phage lysis holin|uniref:phage holin family protein n=1 Tax=Lawsonibacter celer TaxID=2986526 RepID=UPI0016466065|nr:phage holin family protein [Lawsonibacter celer]
MNLNAGTIKNGVLGALALAGSLAAQVLGGWDTALQTLVIFMAVDYVTGILVAAVFHRSGKTERGTLDSRAGFKGLCKKGAMLLTVLVAARLDVLLGGTYARTAVILFFVGNEGLSILENLGLMGAPLPQVLLSALEALKKEADAQ